MAFRQQQTTRIPLREIQRELDRIENNEAALEMLLPAGSIVFHAGDPKDHPGWLYANGRLVSSLKYPRLFAALGTRYGGDADDNTFGLPDLDNKVILTARPNLVPGVGTNVTFTTGSGSTPLYSIRMTPLIKT